MVLDSEDSDAVESDPSAKARHVIYPPPSGLTPVFWPRPVKVHSPVCLHSLRRHSPGEAAPPSPPPPPPTPSKALFVRVLRLLFHVSSEVQWRRSLSGLAVYPVIASLSRGATAIAIASGSYGFLVGNSFSKLNRKSGSSAATTAVNSIGNNRIQGVHEPPRLISQNSRKSNRSFGTKRAPTSQAWTTRGIADCTVIDGEDLGLAACWLSWERGWISPL
ncbi:hypothetical protein NL676_024484 [Syzygium grande]|nr:hypothetical protein NL676_024484 [Syzygium grande]